MTDTKKSDQSEGQQAVKLDEIRVGIDSVDDEIHSLLMRRAAYVEQVAATKRLPDGSLPKGAYRPAREASIMRRLYEQNRTPLPFSVVFTCWREIIGGFTAMQNPISVSVHAAGADIFGTARNHFGAAADLCSRASFHDVIADIEEDANVIGVTPAQFEDSAKDRWWLACTTNEKAPRVIAALPVFGEEITAYCVSHSPLEASGDDETLLAVQLDQGKSLSDISSALESLEIKPLDLSGNGALLRVPGFHIEPNAPIHSAIATALDISPSQVTIVGAYPTPINPLSDGKEKA